MKKIRSRRTQSVIAGLCLSFLAMSCFAQKHESPAGYDLQKPVVMSLNDELKEISGVRYDAGSNTLFAISDEKGDLFEMPLNNPENVSRRDFHKKKDFEDLAIYNGRYYVLNSNGDVYELWLRKGNKVKEDHHSFPFGKGNEFEIMYSDPAAQKLIIICKSCKGDDKQEVSSYSFNPATKKFDKHSFTIDINKLNKMTHNKSRFKPSAAAVHPVTGALFIVSSINKLLVIADRHGNIHEAYHLSPTLFKQPEGLTFTKDGDMIISNESAGNGPANLLLFRYKK